MHRLDQSAIVTQGSSVVVPQRGGPQCREFCASAPGVMTGLRLLISSALIAASPMFEVRAAEEADSSRSPADLFRAFLADPPVVESLVFRERLPPIPKQPWRMDIPLESSRSFRFYEARWQRGALLLRDVAGPEELQSPKVPHLFASRFGGECWFHYGDGPQERILQLGSGDRNSVCRAVEMNSDILRQVLTFGLLDTDVGSVRWHGSSFQVVAPRDEFAVSGDLTISPEGRAESFRVTYKSGAGETYWVIRYGYEPGDRASGLPSIIRCYFQDGEREIERTELTIYTLKTSRTPFGRDSFRPDRIIDTGAWHLVLATNNSAYAVLPGGRLQFIQRLGEPPVKSSPTRQRPSHVEAVYAVWVGVNAAIFILAVRVIGKQKNENT